MLSILNRYKGRNCLFYISKCSGDMTISNMEVYTIFCTRIDFTKMVVISLEFVEIKSIEKHVHGDVIQDA